MTPWEYFSWQDVLGQHSDSVSNYLWEYNIPSYNQYITQNQQTMILGNKTISFDLDATYDNLFTATIVNYIKPRSPFSQYHLEYIEGTSFSLTASDHYEKGIININGQVTITTDITDLDLSKIVKDTLAVYFWDKLTERWETPTSLNQLHR